MSNLTKNEIITLEYLADGQQYDTPPPALTDAQFYVALQSLKINDMVYAAFCEGNTIESSQIKKSGIAALDDMKHEKNRILRNIVKNYDFSLDQYELLKYTQTHGVCHASEKFSQELFGVESNYFKENIWGTLISENYLEVNDEMSGMNLTRKGRQIIEDIEDELYTQLAKGYYNEGTVPLHANSEKSGTPKEVSDGGFRISEDHISDVIKIVWAMHDIGLFVDKDGNKPTAKSVMDAFGKFLQAKQFEQYSSYTNKALKATKNTYLDVFYKMEDSAKKHYDEKKRREIGK